MDKTPQTLAEFLSFVCPKYKFKVAFKYRPRFRALVWTYNDLLNHSLSFRNEIKSKGVNQGDRVILMGYNSPYWVASFFGVQLLGAIPVPLPPESNQEFLQKVMGQTEARLIIKSKFLDVQHIINIPAVNMEDVRKPAIDMACAILPTTKDDIAEIVYTSGSTGEPKGVILTHENILSNVWAAKDAIQITKNARLISILPLFHMFEQTGGMLVPLSVGAEVSHAASLSPNHLKWIFEDDKINRMLLVPEFLRLIYSRIRDQAKEQGSLKKLEALLVISKSMPSMKLRKLLFKKIHEQFKWDMHTIISGGAALDKEVGDFWEAMGIYVIQGYGLTECSPVLTINRYNDRKTNSVGKPVSKVLIKLSDTGEILAKGPNIFRGYWKNPEKTAEMFDKEKWLKTGDVGFFDKDRHLYIKGRKKFMIVLPSGENVHPEDVESKLNKEPEIKDSAVIAVKKPSGAEVHAVLLLKEGIKTELPKIIARVNKKLMGHQQIKSFSVWPGPDFPRTPTKKIKKKEVESWIQVKVQGKSEEAFVSLSLSKIDQIISEVLQLPPSEIEDEKTLSGELGLDSLKRIELVARIESELAVAIEEARIGPETTINDVKEMVKKGEQSIIKYPFDPKLFGPFITFARHLSYLFIIKPLSFILAPTTLHGKENLKNIKRPVFFFANHLSDADAAVIYGSLPSYIRSRVAIAGAADTIYETDIKWVKYSRPILKFFIPVFPFIRHAGQAKSSFLYIGRLIDRNFSVLLFPEGKISRDTRLLPFKEGSGLLSVEMNIPVILVKIANTHKIISPHAENAKSRWRWPKRARVSVTFSKPILIQKVTNYREATKLLEEKMRKL